MDSNTIIDLSASTSDSDSDCSSVKSLTSVSSMSSFEDSDDEGTLNDDEDIDMSTGIRSEDDCDPEEEKEMLEMFSAVKDEVSKEDENQDGSENVCEICGDGGLLLCCENNECARVYHVECLAVRYPDFVEPGVDEKWYCGACNEDVDEFEAMLKRIRTSVLKQ
jgi:hypothetical protein